MITMYKTLLIDSSPPPPPLVVGCYSDSRGIEVIRKHVAEFIGRRDDIPCDWKNVYLVNGASDGIKTLLFMCLTEHRQWG